MTKIDPAFEAQLGDILPALSSLEADDESQALQDQVMEFNLIPGLSLTLCEVHANPWLLYNKLKCQLMYYHPDKTDNPNNVDIYAALTKFKDYYLEGYSQETQVHGCLCLHLHWQEVAKRSAGTIFLQRLQSLHHLHHWLQQLQQDLEKALKFFLTLKSD